MPIPSLKYPMVHPLAPSRCWYGTYLPTWDKKLSFATVDGENSIDFNDIMKWNG